MTLTERINTDDGEGERWPLLLAARKLKDDGAPSQFYVAIPENIRFSSQGWAVLYGVGLPNPGGGKRVMMEVSVATHSSPSGFYILGEEAAEDFVYMMNMARINRKDGP